jgi:hypothetical protein
VTDTASPIRAFTRDLLVNAGALVATSGSGLDVVADATLSARLGLTEFQPLTFTPDADGPADALLVDYDSPVFDKLGRLVDALGRVTFVDGPAVVLKSIDPVAELARALTLQNGVLRGTTMTTADVVYFRFTFEYSLLADERAGGLAHVWVNPATRSVPSMASWSESSDQNDLGDTSPPLASDGTLGLPWPLAGATATAALAPTVTAFLDGLRRRRDRDVRRLREYYIEIDHAIRRKLEGARPNAEVWRREIDRLDATARSYRAQLVDVADRYRVRLHLKPVAVLACRLPTQRVTARLMRRHTMTDAAFSWNPVDGRIESRCCDGCNTPVATAWLCDDRVHILCESCLRPCGQCGKVFCRACHRRCPKRHNP